MAFETAHTSVSYAGNDSTSTPYPITFAFLDAAHIRVLVTAADESETPLTSGQFTVTRFSSGLGQLVTAAAWDGTNVIKIYRITPTVQPVVLEDGALIPAKTLEHALDRLAMIAQETRGSVQEQVLAPHASSHQSGGSDALTLAQSQVTGLVAALAAKAALSPASNQQTGEYTLALTDLGKLVPIASASPSAWIIPPQSSVAWPDDAEIAGAQLSIGLVTVTPGAGVTLYALDDALVSTGRNATWAAKRIGADAWLVTGRLVAA